MGNLDYPITELVGNCNYPIPGLDGELRLPWTIFTSCEIVPNPEPELRLEVLRMDSYSSSAQFIAGFYLSNSNGDVAASSVQHDFNIYGSTGVWIPHTLYPEPSDPGDLVYRFPTFVNAGEMFGVVLQGDTFPYIPYSYDLTVTYNNFETGEAMQSIHFSGSFTINP